MPGGSACPLRHAGQIAYCGDFYGQDEHGMAYHDGITAEALDASSATCPWA